MKTRTQILLALMATVGAAHAQLQIIRQGFESNGSAQLLDRFGSAVASGDFNGDGFGDLASGVPGKLTVSTFRTGAVIVNRGTKWGIGWNNSAMLTPFDGGHLTDPGIGYRFGRALAVGDFDGDGFDDLAVGASDSAVQRVFIYRGSPTGLLAAPTVWKAADYSVSSGSADEFGAALAAGRLDNDGYDDLVIGAPGRSGDTGAVFVLRGSAGGLVLPAAGGVITPASFTFTLSSGCRFGSSLAIGNVGGFNFGDVLAGAPLHDEVGAIDAGAVVLIPGVDTGSGLAAGAALPFFYSDVLTPRTGAKLGTAIAIGDFRGDGGHLDFATSAVFGSTDDTDAVFVWRGLIIPAFERIIDSPLPVANVGKFGNAMAAGDLNGDGRDDLIVSAPDATGSTPALLREGVVYAFNGGPTGPFPTPGTVLRESLYERTAEASLEFGFSLTTGRTTSGLRDSLFIGTPGKDNSSGEVVDYSPWRQPTSVQCASAICVNCDGAVTYALRMKDQVRVASTTKIMTVLLACEAAQRPINDPQRRALNLQYLIEPWTLQGFPNTPGGCSRFNFVQGDVVTFNDLIHAAIMPSGNDAAMCIADAMMGEITTWNDVQNSAPAFVQRMNSRAAAIGMNDSLFTNPPGVDTGSPFSTAWDMYLLGRTAMANSLFAQKIAITNYTMDNTVGDGAANVRTINYGWLNNRRAANNTVIGLKPGSTGGAGWTAVLAAPSGEPGALAYAGGFGWPTFATSGAGADALIKFAQDTCPRPPITTIGDLTSPLKPTHVGLQPSLIAGAVSDLRTDPADGSFYFTMDTQAATQAAGENLDIRIDYRVGVHVEPNEVFVIKINDLHGYSGIGIGNTEDQPALTVDYTATYTGGISRGNGVNIPVMGQTDLTAATHDPLSPFIFTLRNTSATKVFFSLNFQGLQFQPRFGSVAPFRTSTRFSMNLEPERQNYDAALTKTSGVGADVFFNIQSGIGDFIFRPAIESVGFLLTNGATGGRMATLQWTAPESYYSGFRIMHSTDLVTWTPLQTVGPEGVGQLRNWTGVAPAGSRGFFRVEGLVP
jgi:D-alanyl-D-alanine carboxypeptidase/FG-GAP repeat